MSRDFAFASHLQEPFLRFLARTRALAQRSPLARAILGFERVHPTRSVPCGFITLVLSTKHLFDQQDHDETFDLPRSSGRWVT